jgi:hypothetical protein
VYSRCIGLEFGERNTNANALLLPTHVQQSSVETIAETDRDGARSRSDEREVCSN